MKENEMKKVMMLLAGVSALTACALTTSTSAEATNAIKFVTEQPASEWRARLFVGAAVQNGQGEIVGNVNDLVFDRSGRISTVVLGVGGFLGMGEKNVGVPYSALTFKPGKDDARIIVVELSKDVLKAAPTYVTTEKTTMDAVKDKAAELGTKASDKAIELKDQAVKKVDDMSNDEPKKN